MSDQDSEKSHPHYEMARDNGFDSVAEFKQLVAEADLSDPSKRAAFRKWLNDDGSKAGLLALKTQ